MKEYLHQIVASAGNPLSAELMVREYLQARILEFLQDRGAFLNWAFVGGTALRFLYSIPRFSEDLDFSLIDAGKPVDIRGIVSDIGRRFSVEQYTVDMRVSTRTNVASARIQFSHLLQELDLSQHPRQKLSIKLEVDTHTPRGAGIASTVIRRHVVLNLCHHDRPSLLAGKIHAVLTRPWTKGRDLFDLAWYLSDRRWPEPNIEMLNAALKQTAWRKPLITQDTWRNVLHQSVDGVDWDRARADVAPFLEHERDLMLVSADVLRRLLLKQ